MVEQVRTFAPLAIPIADTSVGKFSQIIPLQSALLLRTVPWPE